ncbi:hypothetical protein ES708_24932 [subsurface metagenome]
MKRNILSQLSEIAVMKEALKKEYTISIPYGYPVYDLIIDRNGELLKIQIKTFFWDNSKKRWIVNLNKPTTHKGYKKGEIDYFACYRENPYLLLVLKVENYQNRRSLTITEQIKSDNW